MKRFLFLALEILLWVLVVATFMRTVVVYNNLRALRLEIKSIEEDINREKAVISNIELEISRARTEEGIEKIIRETLLFVKPGESIIILDNP